MKLKPFQSQDLARLALHDGAILGWDTGLGKGLAMFLWCLLKSGFQHQRPLCPNHPCLIIAPGDLHDQVAQEAREKFGIQCTRLDGKEAFLRLASVDPQSGSYTLPPGFYLTSYTQLASNGVAKFPSFKDHEFETLRELFCLRQHHLVAWFDTRGQRLAAHYQRLSVTPEVTLRNLERAWQRELRASENPAILAEADAAWNALKDYTCDVFRPKLDDLPKEKQAIVTRDLLAHTVTECRAALGETRALAPSLPPAGGGEGRGEEAPCQHSEPWPVKCVYDPSLSDLCRRTFHCVAIDEGVKIKGEDTIIGLGVRQMRPEHSLVLSATPIKNRLPDLFRLAWWATGAQSGPHERWPYADATEDRDAFAEEFLVSERNLTREEHSETNRRYLKLTPQVCNVHRVWKLLAPIVLRRRKKDIGEQIVKKIHQPIRVPMGTWQAAVYRYHLEAEYLDCHHRPAIGAQLQALRTVAASPGSALLQPTAIPESLRKHWQGPDPQPPHVSPHSYTPKIAAALNLIHQVLERGEQILLGAAFHDPLDTLSRYLHEAGIRHLVLDGRMSQARRAKAAAQFKLGPPSSSLAIGHRQLEIGHPRIPVLLAGVECMAEGHNFYLANNVSILAYSWAYDKFEQFINRVHRMNSPRDVNVYPILCDGTIDGRLDQLRQEKGDAAELVLDGHLMGEATEEVDLAALLRSAAKEFAAGAKTIDETTLAADWPNLRAQMRQAMRQWDHGGSAGPAIELPEPDNLKNLITFNPQPSADPWRRRLLRRQQLSLFA